MAFKFYYDETEHSRKINLKTLKADNFYDNFMTVIIGWDDEFSDEIEKKYLAFEEKYNDRKSKRKTKAEYILEKSNQDTKKQSFQIEAVSAQIDQAFEQVYIDMDPEEAKKHLMKIVFHMLEIANEIRIMSNAQIRRSGEGEQEFAERIEATEKYLTEKVANNIDKLLIEQTPRLDVKTSKELFGLLGGGVIMNEEYVPVEHSKVFEAIMAQND